MLRSHVSTNNLLQFIQKNIASSNPEVKIRSLIPLVNKQKIYIKDEDINYFKAEEMLKIK